MRCSFLLATLAVFTASPAAAFLSPYRVGVLPSESGEYLLVLLPTPEARAERDQRLARDELSDQERATLLTQKKLEAQYPESGLYRNNGSTTPLWTFGPIADCNQVFVADDGVHLILAFAGWDCFNCSSRCGAVEFYANGQRLDAYREEEILSGYWLRFLICRVVGAEYARAEALTLNNQAGEFDLATNHGDRLTFGIATGKIVDSSSPWRTGMAIALVTIPVGLVLLLGWALWRQRRKGVGCD